MTQQSADDRQNLLSRIKKLMALSSSSNPNEAAAALSRAQKLMSSNGISARDLKLSVISEQTVQTAPGLRSRAVALMLARIICKALGIDSFYTHRYGNVTSITFIGKEDRLDLADYMMTFLCRQAAIAKKEFRKKYAEENKPDLSDQLARMFFEDAYLEYLYRGYDPEEEIEKNYKSGLRRQTEMYMRGWMAAVRDKVAEFTITEEERMLIEDYKHTKHPELVTSYSRAKRFTAEDCMSMQRGREDAKSGFSLLRGVAGMPSPALEDHR